MKSIIIIKLLYGGYVVKNHDVMNNNTDMLFSGSLEDCLSFLKEYLLTL